MFNVNQQHAIDSDAKTILCNAAAGSGKTTVLIERMIRIREDLNVSFNNMLCLTFTRLAGREMKERILKKDPEARNLFANTFHAFGVQMIKDFGHRIGMESNFSIYDEDDEKDIVMMVIKNLDKKISWKKYQSFLRDELEDPLQVLECVTIQDEFYSILRENNAVHFDGILNIMVQLLKIDDIRQHYHDTYKYVFVDETQDTNKKQFEVVELINSENKFFVGDINQSIYGWRGAYPQQFVDIVDKYENVDVVIMNDNYRSTHQILAAANNLMKHKKQTFDCEMQGHKDGDHVEYQAYKNSKDEYWCTMLDILDRYPEEDFKNVAVISKKNNTLLEFQEVCESKSVPTVLLSSSNDPLKSDEVKRLLMYLKVANNKRDMWSLKRILMSLGVSNIEILNMEKLAFELDCELYDVMKNHENMYVSEVIKVIERIEVGPLSDIKRTFSRLLELLNTVPVLKGIGLYTRVQHIEESSKIISKWSASRKFKKWRYDVDSFLKWIMLRDIREKEKEEKTGIRLLTFHGSKGLEFDHVYILDCSDGNIPDYRGNPEEQLNLMYVGATRAKEYLTISYPVEKRFRYNKNSPWFTKEQDPSPYIDWMKELSFL